MQLQMISSMSFETEHALMHRVVGTDIYREIVTKINKKTGKIGKASVAWYHAKDKETHATYEEAAKFRSEP